jgi:S-disulfanyl-L-cysteine oxidoreductase SoxD
MSRSSRMLVALMLAAGPTAAVAFEPYPGIGRAATAAEVEAWDIDVRPDFKGLPEGKGTAGEGEVLWEAQCASCHGIFGESNEVFAPLVGGTTQEDIKTGRVRALAEGSFPQRTTMMKVPTVATLFDYIRRAMPWTAPKSLSDDQVYALLAYMLSLAEVIPHDYELNEQTIRDVQHRMPNRNGMTTDHGMWPGAPAAKGGIGNGGIPDVQNIVCMSNCKDKVELVSALPEHARDAHGNLADQNRVVGPVRGQQTVEPAEQPAAAADDEGKGYAVAKTGGCMACHGVESRIVGPGFRDIVVKHRDRADAAAYLADRIRKGGSGVWGAIPMPPQGQLTDEELAAVVKWLLSGAKAQ